MSLATLDNVPQSEDQFHVFSFANQDHHRRIIDAIRAQKGVELTEHPLDPIPFYDPGNWLRNHQQMHADFTNVLGISGSDLSSVDWQDEAEVASWINLHTQEHQQADTILGIHG